MKKLCFLILLGIAVVSAAQDKAQPQLMANAATPDLFPAKSAAFFFSPVDPCPSSRGCPFAVNNSGVWASLHVNSGGSLLIAAGSPVAPTASCPSPGGCPYAQNPSGVWTPLSVDSSGNLIVSGSGGTADAMLFSGITSATNSTAAMVVGTGASLAVSGSGTIAATTAAALAANPADCSTNQYATTIAASGALTCSTWSINETPSGTVNSSNVTFTLAQTPVTGSVACYQNGLRVAPAGADYTLSGTTLTWATAPTTGDTLMCDYRY